MNHRKRTAVPGLGAAAGVPGDVELVPLGIDGRAVRAAEGAADFLLVEGVQAGDHLPLPCFHVVLHDRGAVLLAAAMSAGNVVEVASAGIGIERGNVGVRAHGGGSELLN